MQGFSFREYLGIETGIRFERITLADLLAQHTDKAREVNEQIKPFQHFDNYLQHGYYPYYKEESDLYFMRLGEVLNMMLEIELPLLRQIDLAYVAKIKQLLTVIAESVPFIPNVSKLSENLVFCTDSRTGYSFYSMNTGKNKEIFQEKA